MGIPVRREHLMEKLDPKALYIKKCLYCDEVKEVKVWKETNELVCKQCREGLLEQEFENAKPQEDLELDFTEAPGSWSNPFPSYEPTPYSNWDR
jgi:hypothetical protein